MKSVLSILSVLFLISCGGSGGGKKVLVMASGKISVNGNTVELQPGTSHNEQTISPEGDNLSVVSPSGTEQFSIPENGYYILNLKKDTIAGTYQRVGKEGDTQAPKITQDDLKLRIDSLYHLMIAHNLKEGQYNLPPFSIQKITDNTGAEIIGPFRPMPSSFNPAKEHEVYKFQTNKEIWDLILRLHKMTR